ncbi:MAG: class II aldolase/adducin family protein [Candidatus Bipolaricaulota bacterium]|nr:class II aldolase/adducin family protein [Candidatus Bipolaricaulota bacterium]MDW8126950.1 class II aldolase/adducin family protein [Candidatus Bipolaricaulota bacterium]
MSRTFRVWGAPTPGLVPFLTGLTEALKKSGYTYDPDAQAPDLVLNACSLDDPRPYRRRAQATFVLSILEAREMPGEPVQAMYPYLVRTLANMLLVYIPGKEAHFFTLDLGHYSEPEGEKFFDRLVERIQPMASATLVIKNRFEPDLEPELWDGDDLTRALSEAGKILESWDLLPAPFPIDRILPPEDFRHVQRLYGIGGLSYGNLSVRKDAKRFWMSASGVDKANLRVIGRDILLVKDYDPSQQCIVLSVPPHIEPRRVSVDAIEHWMIYREHPEVRAIIHVHAWMDGVLATQAHYPCGSYELARSVAELVRKSPDPACAVIGLKNHGLTITGRSLEEILDRIAGKLIRQVPMT